ncbi:uncharacterized protein LOC124808867 [Hydra vulgaris]|uniref:uncharacterized protein LOC124808867 n=1 Tax=Hydra vulgaris TaxID=6087 RepID=UPI001F5EEBAF|nr:uncharacterized protein LOC124808867 [Hydra vulgaris]
MSSGKRQIQSSGTRKIEKNCTATIKVFKKLNGIVTARVCYSHYGHRNKVQHIFLTSTQKKVIAGKLHIGISKARILDEIRDEMGCFYSRLHLTQRKDLNNLEKAFNISSVQLHANDQDSVRLWLKEWELKGNNPVLYYKLQGEADPSNTFKHEDFVVIIQTEHQKKMIQQFGKHGVCIDSTHGTNAYDFLLTTILVIHELGKGQPAGWCIANSDSFSFLKLFFLKLKESFGDVCPIWTMSDMASQYYEAFCAAYSCFPLKFWCTWHVDKAWRIELHKKIQNLEIEADIYKRLRFILQLDDRKLLMITCNHSLDICNL